MSYSPGRSVLLRAFWLWSGPVLLIALYVHRYVPEWGRIRVVSDGWNTLLGFGAALAFTTFVLDLGWKICAWLQTKSSRWDYPRFLLFNAVSLSAALILVYALVYVALGVGGSVTGNARLTGILGAFGDAIYLSAVTFSTLGYGDVQPLPAARPVAALEPFAGLVLVALVLGAVVNRLSDRSPPPRFLVMHTGRLPGDLEPVWCVVDTWCANSSLARVDANMTRRNADRLAEALNRS